jgi:uncharacterized membrane protein YgaE (UPF0421/DUF939 family)
MVNAPHGTTSKPSWQGALVHGVSAAFVALFCYSTARLFPLPEPYWAPIAAIVVLYPDREATMKAAWQQFLGTAAGSVVGWASAAWWHGNLVVYGVAVWCAVGLCYLLRLEAAARLCAVAVTVITLIPRPEPAHLVAFHRFVEVSYGVACALVCTVATDLARRRWRSRGA